MKYGSLIFEKKEFLTIKSSTNSKPLLEDYAHKNLLDMLKKNMNEAILFNDRDMPTDIVRLYSLITVKCSSGWVGTFQLVLPKEVDTKKNRFSVISSVGASFIGLSEGDAVRYGLPGNSMVLKINKVTHIHKKKPLDIPRKKIENDFA